MPIIIDHAAPAVPEMVSGMATPLYGSRGIHVAHVIMAINAMIKVNMPSFRLVGVCSRAADWISNDSESGEKNATETM